MTSFPRVTAACSWRPRMDPCRGPGGWPAKLDPAGVRPQDMQVDLRGRLVQIRGVRRDARLQADWQHYALEIQYGRFERFVALPDRERIERVTLRWRDGKLFVAMSTSPPVETP